MKKLFLLLATLVWAQVAAAAESKFIDDAPKGFIHITGESYGAAVHHYLRTNSVSQLQQFSEEDEGKMRHYVRLCTVGTPTVQLEFATKEEADKIRARIMELLSAKD